MTGRQQGHPERQGSEETDLNETIRLLRSPGTLLEGIRQLQNFVSNSTAQTLPRVEQSPIALIANGLDSLTDDSQKNQGLGVIRELTRKMWTPDFEPDLQSLIPRLMQHIRNSTLCSNASDILKCAANNLASLKNSIQEDTSLVEATCDIGTSMLRQADTETRSEPVMTMLVDVFDRPGEVELKRTYNEPKYFIRVVMTILHVLVEEKGLKTSIETMVPLLSGCLILDSEHIFHKDALAVVTKLAQDAEKVDEIMAVLDAAPAHASPVPILTLVEALMSMADVEKVPIKENVLKDILKWPLTDNVSLKLAFNISSIAIKKWNTPITEVPVEVFVRAKSYLKSNSADTTVSLAALDLLALEQDASDRRGEDSSVPFKVLGELLHEAVSYEEKRNVVRVFKDYCESCTLDDLRSAWEKCRDGHELSKILDLVESGDNLGNENAANDQGGAHLEDPASMRKKMSRLLRSSIFFFMTQLMKARESDEESTHSSLEEPMLVD